MKKVPDKIIHNGKEYFSTRFAARLSGYHPDYIGQLTRAGELEETRIGRSHFVARDALFSLLENRRRAPSSSLVDALYTHAPALSLAALRASAVALPPAVIVSPALLPGHAEPAATNLQKNTLARPTGLFEQTCPACAKTPACADASVARRQSLWRRSAGRLAGGAYQMDTPGRVTLSSDDRELTKQTAAKTAPEKMWGSIFSIVIVLSVLVFSPSLRARLTHAFPAGAYPAGVSGRQYSSLVAGTLANVSAYTTGLVRQTALVTVIGRDILTTAFGQTTTQFEKWSSVTAAALITKTSSFWGSAALYTDNFFDISETRVLSAAVAVGERGLSFSRVVNKALHQVIWRVNRLREAKTTQATLLGMTSGMQRMRKRAVMLTRAMRRNIVREVASAPVSFTAAGGLLVHFPVTVKQTVSATATAMRSLSDSFVARQRQ